MEKLNYFGMDYKDGQVDVAFHLKDFESVLSLYEQIKYSNVDLGQRPERKVIVEKLVDDLGETLEEALEDNYDTLVIGYTDIDTFKNNFISFNYEVVKSDGSDIVVKIRLKDEWSEDI